MKTLLVIPRPAMVTSLLLAVALVAFAGPAYQTVPRSKTQTMTQESTENLESYLPYFVTSTVAYTTTSFTTHTDPYHYFYYYTYGNLTMVIFSPATLTVHSDIAAQSTYEYQNAVTIQYSQTVTSSVTVSSTSLVPVSSALGLTQGSFTGLAVVVIGILALSTAWVTLKPRITPKPKPDQQEVHVEVRGGINRPKTHPQRLSLDSIHVEVRSGTRRED